MKISAGQKSALVALLTTSVMFTTVTEAQANETVPTQTISVEKTNTLKIKSVEDQIEVSSKAALVNALVQQMKQFSTTGNYLLTDSTVDIQEALNAAIKADEYVAGTYKTVQISYSGRENARNLTINVTYQHTAAQEQAVTNYVRETVARLITSDMTAIEKIKVLHDEVVLKTTYTSSSSAVSVHSPYAITQYGIGVCQAYALLTYRLLEEAGIEAKYVTGTANGVGHAWNLVKLGGTWYHLDTTWDDSVFSGNPYVSQYINCDYFLISQQQILKDHTIDAGYPIASTSDYFPGLNGKSSLLSYGNLDFLNLPSYVDNVWYYANPSNNYRLTALRNGQETALTKTGAFAPTYANGKVYYMDDSLQAFAYDIATQQTQNLNVSKATNIRIENNNVVIYNGNTVVYRASSNEIAPTPVATPVEEPMQPPVTEQPDQQPVEEQVADVQPIQPPAEDRSADVQPIQPPTEDQIVDVQPIQPPTEEQPVEKVDEGAEVVPPVTEVAEEQPQQDPTEQVAEKPVKDVTQLPAQDASKDSVPDQVKSSVVTTLKKIVKDIPTNMVYANFKRDAEKAVTVYNALSVKEKAALSKADRVKIKAIEEKLDKLKAFSKTSMAKGTTKSTIKAKKTWTMTLKSKVKNTATNRKRVVVYDQFGEKVACTVKIKGNKVMVTPKKAYAENVPYVINVSKKIVKTNGKALNKETNMKFKYKKK